MPTYVIYSDSTDGYLECTNATYATARSGGGTLTSDTSAATITVGQYHDTTYYVEEAFLSFDTSSVVGVATSAVLSLYLNTDGSTSADFTINARAYDWGSSLTTADWIAGASLSGNTLRASYGTASLAAGYNDFTSEATFKDNLTNPVRLVLASSRTEAGTSNATNPYSDYVSFKSANETGTSSDPKLTIVTSLQVTYTADAVISSPTVTKTYTADAVIGDAYDWLVRTTSGVQSHWKLNETSGSSIADSIGSVTGTKGSGVTVGSTKLTPSSTGYSATFDGDPIHANIDCGNNYKFSGTAAWTLEAWFNSTNFNPTNSSNHIFGAYNGTNGYRFAVASSGKMVVTRGADTLVCSTTLSTSTTYHLVATFDGSNLKGYVNGVLDGTQASTASITAAATNAFISSTYSGVGAMQGRLDNVAVYNVALSDSTIADHYNVGAGTLLVSYTADAVVYDRAVTKTYTADALVQDRTFTKTYTADAVVRQVTIDKTFTADAHIVYDAWGLGAAWSKRKVVGIAGTLQTQTDYPVTVTVTYDSDMQADFDDVRFTAADGSTQLTYWRGAYTASSTATFYVVVPTVRAGTADLSGTYGGGAVIYMYYGNPAASYAGETLGANGIFTYDGGSNAVPNSPGTSLIEAGTSGAWDDSYIASDGAFVKNLDGSLYVDGSGYGWVVYNGANQARRATIDLTAPYDGDNAPGDDCPGLFKFLASDPDNTLEKVSVSDPFLKWGSGTWDPSSGTTWDGRVVQQGHIFYDADGDVVNAGEFVCFYDGDAGPANVYEAYREGVAIGVGANPGAATWTKKSTGNPSGQAWTFQHSQLNIGSADDLIAYAGGFVYDPDEPNSNKRWKQWYTGHTASKWGIMYATAPDYDGPWTRHQSTYVWQPRPSDGGWNGWVDWVMKVRGVYYLGYVSLGHDTDTDGRKKWAFYVGRSTDGVNWTLDGEYFNRSTDSGDWDYGRVQGPDVVYNHVTGEWMQHYTASDIGNGAYGDTPAYVPPLKIAVSSWDATPPALTPEPSIGFASEQTYAGKTYTADAIILGSGATKTYTADAVIFEPVRQKTYTADAIVFGTPTKTYTADALVTDVASQSTALSWFFRHRRSSMSQQTKTYTVVQAKGTTRTATWTSPTYLSKTEAGILVVLDVTSASGTGGLTLRINAQDSAGSVSVPLNSAPTAVTATGTTSYAVYPFGAISGALTQSTSGYLPREFSITVTHGDSSSYTYSVGYCLLP